MIVEIRPLASGAALALTLQPPAGALRWRVMRKATNDIASQDDATALNAYEGVDTFVVDAEPGLVNEVPMFYAAFYWNGAAWASSAAMSGTPQATYEDQSTDVLRIVRNRLEDGFKVEVAAGRLNGPTGAAIVVLSAPPTADQAPYPLVVIESKNAGSQTRGIGEFIAPDALLADGTWDEHEGWLESVQLDITGWSLNPDERNELARAIKRILIANFPVFDAAGMAEIALSQSPQDFLGGEFQVNLFATSGTLTCQAPVIVRTSNFPSITDVQTTAIGDEPVTP